MHSQTPESSDSAPQITKWNFEIRDKLLNTRS